MSTPAATGQVATLTPDRWGFGTHVNMATIQLIGLVKLTVRALGATLKMAYKWRASWLVAGVALQLAWADYEHWRWWRDVDQCVTEYNEREKRFRSSPWGYYDPTPDCMTRAAPRRLITSGLHRLWKFDSVYLPDAGVWKLTE